MNLGLTNVYTMYILNYWRHRMQTVIQKWGNSLGVRIPQGFAQELGLTQGSNVDVFSKNGKLEIVPCKKTLDMLLSDVTDTNIHTAIETGAARGAEAW